MVKSSKNSKMLKVSFLGDISLNNKYSAFNEQRINPFKSVSTLLSDSLVIGNLECLSYGNDGENILKNPRLSTKQDTLDLLSNLNIDVVTLAHNHVYDNLKSGFQKTTNKLDSLDIKYLGASLNVDDCEREIIIKENDITLGLLNFVSADTNPHMPKDADVFLNYFSETKAISSIKKIRDKVDFVIVLLHWGGIVEEGFYPDKEQPSIARVLIDEGADLIVGGHSHTIQPFEIYKNKYIFYSLGNFCFDDINMDGKIFEIGKFRKRKSMIVNVIFNNGDYKVKIIPIRNNNGIILKSNRLFFNIKIFKRNLLFRLTKSNKLMWNIYFSHLKNIVPLKMFFLESNSGFIEIILKLKFKRIFDYVKKRL